MGLFKWSSPAKVHARPRCPSTRLRGATRGVERGIGGGPKSMLSGFSSCPIGSLFGYEGGASDRSGMEKRIPNDAHDARPLALDWAFNDAHDALSHSVWRPLMLSRCSFAGSDEQHQKQQQQQEQNKRARTREKNKITNEHTNRITTYQNFKRTKEQQDKSKNNRNSCARIQAPIGPPNDADDAFFSDL